MQEDIYIKCWYQVVRAINVFPRGRIETGCGDCLCGHMHTK